jgi:hypothetical protein
VRDFLSVPIAIETVSKGLSAQAGGGYTVGNREFCDFANGVSGGYSGRFEFSSDVRSESFESVAFVGGHLQWNSP